MSKSIEERLSQLPGQTAFAFTELRDGQPQPLFAVRADQRMAVGSSFKLYILGALIDEVNQGRRQFENIMLLRPDLEGPPHSEMADWPQGSPVTLHTLALKMISISDNTATDHLLYLLGRERVEAQMATMGHGDPAINRPLLSTRDMVELRDKNTGLLGREYQKMNETARRALLEKLSAGRPAYEKLNFDAGAYKIAEWYASPLDMAQSLAWIYRNTKDDQPGREALAILAVDPKLSHDTKIWPYVGFKGGSEDQLLAGNWLLKNQNGRWYTMHLFCNSPDSKVDPQKMIAAVTEVFALIQSTLE